MRFAYVSNTKNLASDGKCFNSEWHVGETLKALGHEVDYIQEDEITPYSLAYRVRGADIFLHTRTWPDKVTLEDLKMIEGMGIPTVSWHLDKYTGIQRNGGLGTDTFWKTQYVFSPEGSDEAKAIFKSHGINHFYLPAGVYEPECYLAEPELKYMHDIIFVGGGKQYAHSEWPYRAKLVTWLEDTYGSRFKHYGWPDESVRGEELNKLYASAKIVIGDSLCKDFKDEYYFSDRVFETTGRGGFIIHPMIRGLEDHFNIMTALEPIELVVYPFNNFNKLQTVINYYLNNPYEREKVRLAGHERTKRTNTYTQRMQQMLKVLKDEGAI